MQRVVRNVVLHDVAPDHFAGPIGQRTDFYQVELRVPVHLVRCGAVAGLFATDCRHPRIERGQFSAQRLDLSQTAA